jgi:NADH:ubiquinone oxidoreductase subunit 6 (subunit J)
MMLDFSRPVVQATSQPSYKLRAFFVMSCFIAEILTLLYIKGSSPMLPLDRLPWSIQNLALRLFNDYAFPFEVAGAILLFAMVAVIGLVKEEKAEDDVSAIALKRQNVADQVRVKKSDRLIVVKSS